MRKYFMLLFGVIRFSKEYLLNWNNLTVNGFEYYFGKNVKVLLYNKGKCKIDKHNWFAENSIIESNAGKISIGFNNFFNTNCKIISLNSIEIGNNNLIGPNVIIVDHDHKFDQKGILINQQGFKTNKITLGSDIWIGANVVITKGVSICDKVIVGANSTITKNINQSGIYLGNPAKLYKRL
ncbi:acyltransferase [Carnobacterium inhibens]|uniref:Acyltransferase n=1 Tax=Carnobacterium inhibens TaxID=147709 RepID=A0ABR7TE07_9LACT|nr:acyltransferase [Carnobacterium inhibens]MBC9825915.1 acyltransferase [Carnobacterium inhibens]